METLPTLTPQTHVPGSNMHWRMSLYSNVLAFMKKAPENPLSIALGSEHIKVWSVSDLDPQI